MRPKTKKGLYWSWHSPTLPTLFLLFFLSFFFLPFFLLALFLSLLCLLCFFLFLFLNAFGFFEFGQDLLLASDIIALVICGFASCDAFRLHWRRFASIYATPMSCFLLVSCQSHGFLRILGRGFRSERCFNNLNKGSFLFRFLLFLLRLALLLFLLRLALFFLLLFLFLFDTFGLLIMSQDFLLACRIIALIPSCFTSCDTFGFYWGWRPASLHTSEMCKLLLLSRELDLLASSR